MVSYTYEGLDISALNKANIIFIPKKEEADTVQDFRPISILNLILKLISKLLADRLGPLFPSIISPFQTSFIRGRQISENFITAREMLHQIASSKNSCNVHQIGFHQSI